MPTSRSPAGSRGGTLAGLLEARDSILPALDDQLQELAAGLTFALNAAHNDATALPPPAQLSGSRTDLSAFAAATRSGTATFAVIDHERRQHAAGLPDRPRRGRRRDAISPPRSTPRSARSAAPRSAAGRQSRDHARQCRPGARDRRGRHLDRDHRCGRPRCATTASRTISGSTTSWSATAARASDFAVRGDIADDACAARHRAARRRGRPAARRDPRRRAATTAAPRRSPTR